MPPTKYSSNQRVWGTRFDTLSLNSPSPSPPDSPRASDTPNTASEPQVEAGGQTSLVEDAQSSWQSQPLQDQSVFVGSLPGHVDSNALQDQLINHLSLYDQALKVKVVRDAKGGVCAFIQCEDATRLIEVLQKEPRRQFLGRYLRYEPARAYRTLFIFYRTPPPSTHVSGSLATAPALPYAMRLCRALGSKHLTILFDNEAKALGSAPSPSERDGSFTDHGLLIDEMNYDAEMIRVLASTFGSIEQFEAINQLGGAQTNVFMASDDTHSEDIPRTNGANVKGWKIKWHRRDDAVAALMTLRRLSFLDISWAHRAYTQPASSTHMSQAHEFIHPARRFEHAERVLPPRAPGGLLTPSSSFGGAYVPGHVDPTVTPVSHIEDLDGLSPGPGEVINPAMPASLWGDIPQAGCGEAVPLSKSIAHRETTSCGLPTPRPSIETIGVSTVRPSVAPAAGVPPRFPLPDLSHSPITPRTPNSEFPYTPADGVQALPLDSKPPIAGANQTTGERLDPFSIFVGGLEAVHWDDARLVSIFEQYGSIEDVRTVKPTHQRTGFAYVKFYDTEAPRKAIAAEHNQLYNGRPIRVQIRSLNPPSNVHKNGFAHGARGRGGRFMRSYGGSPRTGLGLEVEPTDRRQGSHRLPGQNFANGDTRTLATSSTASSPTALSGNPGLGATTAVDPPAPMSTFTPPPQVPMPMQPGWPMQPQPVLFSYPVHYAPMLPSHGGGVIAPPPLPMALGDTNSGPTNMAPRMWTPIMYGHMPFASYPSMGTPQIPPVASAAAPGPVPVPMSVVAPGRPVYPTPTMVPHYPMPAGHPAHGMPMPVGPPMHGQHQVPYAHFPVVIPPTTAPSMHAHGIGQLVITGSPTGAPPPSVVEVHGAGSLAV